MSPGSWLPLKPGGGSTPAFPWPIRDLQRGDTVSCALSVLTLLLCFQDGPIMNISPPPPEDTSGEPPGERRDLPWGATFELPQMLLERDRWAQSLGKSEDIRSWVELRL